MILGRLKKALRDQNWFAVLLEIVIVVLGVVIGFQISAWGETRANRDKEQGYLMQLSEDLSRTIRYMDVSSERLLASGQAAELLFDNYWQPEPLPNDSVLALISSVTVLDNTGPILGTVEALVDSGDLALIQNDKLRLVIPAFLERQRSIQEVKTEFTNLMIDAFNTLAEYADLAEADIVQLSKGNEVPIPRPQVKSIEQAPNQRPPFPFNSRRFFGNMNAYNSVYRIHHMKIQSAMMRTRLRNDAKGMLDMIKQSQGLTTQLPEQE